MEPRPWSLGHGAWASPGPEPPRRPQREGGRGEIGRDLWRCRNPAPKKEGPGPGSVGKRKGHHSQHRVPGGRKLASGDEFWMNFVLGTRVRTGLYDRGYTRRA
jgi:hypothetical protein